MRKTRLQEEPMPLEDPSGTAQAKGPCGHPCGHVIGCLTLRSTSLKRQTQEKVTITVGPPLTEVSVPYFR